jgi:hypothetical protein
MWLLIVVSWIGMVEYVDNQATYERQPHEKDENKRMFSKRLMKG